jgi:hypothetical protein
LLAFVGWPLAVPAIISESSDINLGSIVFAKRAAHFLSARPVHVLDEQVASHSPQLRVALQQSAHSVERFLPLRHVAWANSHRNVVFADIGVVNLFNNNTFAGLQSFLPLRVASGRSWLDLFRHQ